MAFLNAKEREALRDDLKGRTFRGAKWKLRWMDKKGRLVYHRNSQKINQWQTRFELGENGVIVTLIESNEFNTHKDGKVSNDYTFVDVVVEPSPDNKN